MAKEKAYTEQELSTALRAAELQITRLSSRGSTICVVADALETAAKIARSFCTKASEPPPEEE